jgi:hypothetical protein
MTRSGSSAAAPDEVYMGLCAQRAYRHIKLYTEPAGPRCEDFLYIIKRGIGLRAA